MMEHPQPESASGKMPKPARHDGPARIGRFTTLDRIGAGGMGELFLAWDPQLDRKLAIKLVHARSSGPAAEQRLRLEAKAIAQLSHPNVVQVFEVGTHAGRVYVAMEFVEGQSLRDWLAALELDGPKRIAAILECFIAAGRGLEAVHGAGLIHRDFKPSNVVVGDDDRVRIIDFGLASELDEDDASDPPGGPTTPVDIEHGRKHWDSTLTDTGVLLGTPRYMAPEQWRGRPGDQGSDQFGYCVALFEALYGVHPFERPDVDFAEAIKRGAIEFPVRRPEWVPARVRDALVRGLSVDPSLRFTSMGELLEMVAPPPPPTGRRALLAGLGLVLAAGLALALLLVPESDDSGAWMLTQTRREAFATRDLVRVEQRVAELGTQGQIAEADATFAAFAELPDYAATAALGRGWLNHAARLAARGDSDGELDAYGAAYLSAEPDTQREALFGLARVFARTREWAKLGAALDTIESLDVVLDESQRAELLGMRVHEMVSRRELAGAVRALGSAGSGSAGAIHPALASTIVELAHITPTEHDLDGYELRLAPMPGLDLDEDGVGELLVFRPGEAQLTVLGSATASLAPIASIQLSEAPGGLAILPNVDEPLLSLRHDTRLTLNRVGISETDGALTLTKLFEYDQGTHWPSRWASGDLDGDGHIEAYAGLAPKRRLLVAQAGPSGWVHGDPHPATTAADSVTHDLVVGDLDGDARLELAVAVGEWSAYDLRILGVPVDAPTSTPTSTSTPPILELLGRRKLGTVQSVALIDAPSGKAKWLAVGVADIYPSRRVFPNPPANGVPGVYVFAWDGEALEQIAFVDVPAPDLIYAGDFNADGLDDLALAGHAHGRFDTTVLVQTSPRAFEPMMLVGLWPVGVIDRDRDGDDELLVLDTNANLEPNERPGGRLHVLGSGEGQLPSLADAEPTPGQPLDTHVEDALGASIARAEDLATIGLSLRSAAELRKLARVAEPELAAHLWVRAAELLEAQGHRLEAADLYAQASIDARLLGMRAGPTRRKAMQLYEAVHRLRAAADMAASALELDSSDAALQAERTRLETLANDDPELVFDFDDPLDSSWIVDPLAVRRRAGRLELSMGGKEVDVIARRELYWSGGRLALEVELEVERIEWSSEIMVELRPLDDPPAMAGAPLRVGALTRGGGGLYQLYLKCAGDRLPEPGVEGYPISQPQAELPEDRRRFRLRAELVPGPTGKTWCTADGSGVHVETALPDPGLAPGRYELVIHGSQVERWGRATASIDRIVITGGQDVPEHDRQPGSLADAIARDLAEGRMEAALAGLHDAGTQLGLDARDRALLQFVALDELGQPERREAALITAIDDCGDDERSRVLVGRLLAQRPEHLGADLHRLCGADDYFSILVEVWATAIYQHPESATVGRVLTTQTVGLERWQPRDVADRAAVLTLLCARARARSSLGTPGPNRADLERAVELGDRWQAEAEAEGKAETEPVGPTKLATQLGWCRVDLAAERLDRGEEDGAIETLRETLRRSPTPEILADMLTIDPRFVSLRERAAWRELIEPARAGARLHGSTAPR